MSVAFRRIAPYLGTCMSNLSVWQRMDILITEYCGTVTEGGIHRITTQDGAERY